VLAHYFPLMTAAVRRFPSDEWTTIGARAGVPLQPVRTAEEALVDPALERRELSSMWHTRNTGRFVRWESCTG